MHCAYEIARSDDAVAFMRGASDDVSDVIRKAKWCRNDNGAAAVCNE
jgi:hypothetical protein